MQLHERKYIYAYIVVIKLHIFITFLLLKPLLIQKMLVKTIAKGTDNEAEEENTEMLQRQAQGSSLFLLPFLFFVHFSPTDALLTLCASQGLDTPLYQLAWHIMIASFENVSCQRTVVIKHDVGAAQ